MKTKINEAIKQVLQQFGEKYFIEEVLNKNRVVRDLDTYDKDLLEAFISNETLKSNFTIDIAGNIVMQTNKLIELFEADEYWQDSYTKYSKKIGLTAGGKFIDESTDVVLDFPYKDTILKASMSKEDNDKDDLRPNEPFLNEVIAKEEIDVLLDKKILVNAKKYDEKGEHEVDSFSEEDNLIMKGNNLIALHMLKERYAGKVKTIYIDPPYNTGNDGFKYNDSFNRSTWLTFMKNRLEIARDLLSDEGSIWINIDSNESHYLNVLLDNIFNEENFVADIIWNHTKQSKNDERFFSRHYNHLLVYAKDKENLNKFEAPRTEEDNKNYKNPDNDPNGLWRAGDVRSPNLRETLKFDITAPNGEKISPPENGWRWSKKTIEEKIENGEIIFKQDYTGIIRKIYLKNQSGRTPENIWTDSGTTREANQELKQLFGKSPFSTPKPEKLIKTIIQLGTKENDVVLDFFMGSSTTQAVAHKMNRRYIGIEQMDYINTVSVPRLQKVIEGEQGGISKDVEWQGGGSFVYVELMEKNRGFLKSIRDARTQTELHEVFDFMLKEAEIDFRVDLEAVKETLHELSFDDQKKTLIKIIDKNQLYYNYSEIDDENVRDLISNSDYAFNKNFYNEGGE
ncbi:site-specific DNA-methyltransferase [Bacillus safensis]|uniref:site-specific DNA-methyltransferase n=1 Tax=Bacillus safensis TaxID=561879 RepID=UPI002076412C|nr:site-specific DNA-methyltransferase [Bacillus safensis]USD79320.1 site-specific DNA-methyltransferase [Bacillus safensis]